MVIRIMITLKWVLIGAKDSEELLSQQKNMILFLLLVTFVIHIIFVFSETPNKC